MKGTSIIACSDPKGKFLEGIISGTPKPGVRMQIVAATEPINGRLTWAVYVPVPGTDGGPGGAIAILTEDTLQGKTTDDAYVTATRCFMYCPAAGEEMNIRVGEVAGTANSYAIGDLLMSDAEDGIFVPNLGGQDVPFQVMETAALIAGSSLVLAMCTGH